MAVRSRQKAKSNLDYQLRNSCNEARLHTAFYGSFAGLFAHNVAAQFERSMILKRQAEGIAVAKAKGAYKGRKASIDRDVISKMIKAGSSLTSIAKSLGISRQSVHRIKAELGL